MYNEKATKCIATKLNLEGKEHKVDWTALGALHRRILLRHRVARIKFLFRWAPTNVQQYLNGKSGTKRFPLCNDENEMMTHLFCCKDSNTRDNRMVVLDKLEDKLVEGRTHPDLVTLILLAVEGKTEVLKEAPIQHHNGDDIAK